MQTLARLGSLWPISKRCPWSIIADKLALHIVGSDGYVINEAGLASDVGFEKFINIKCPASGLMPDCAILVATVQALKWHGRELALTGAASQDRASDPSINDGMAQLKKGLVNLEVHIRNIRDNFNVPVEQIFRRSIGPIGIS